MSPADRFARALSTARRRTGEPELLPGVLVDVCADLLAVDGAGLCLTESLRLPLAASNADAAQAERLQTSLGQGPCLSAAAAAEPLVAGLDEIERSWPVFYRGLVSQTPFQSVMSVPLCSPDGRCFGAMDLYSTHRDPEQLGAQVDDGISLADQITGILLAAPAYDDGPGVTGYTWLATTSVKERMKVWMAVGTLVAHAKLRHRDALSLLRGYAYSHDTSIDDIAHQMVTETLKPEALT